MYLTADEAALLGKSLLEAATFVAHGENVHAIADALAAPGGDLAVESVHTDDPPTATARVLVVARSWLTRSAASSTGSLRTGEEHGSVGWWL
jgi:hypothetical protein